MACTDSNKSRKPQYKTFMDWLRLMNENHYILLFIIGVAGFMYILTRYESTVAFYILIGITTRTLILIVYRGFYQHWNDMRKRRR